MRILGVGKVNYPVGAKTDLEGFYTNQFKSKLVLYCYNIVQNMYRKNNF